MTLQEITETKRIQDAFISRLKATPEEKLNPKQFVAKKLKEYAKETTIAYEDDKAIEEAKVVFNSKKQELVV